MKTIQNLEQGSSQWLDFRRTRITATDAAAICGQNPFKHPWDVFDEKLGFKEPDPMNDAMRRGQLLEPDARALISLELKQVFNPIVAVHDDYPWAMASLDGINDAYDIITEIKSPGLKKHTEHCQGIVAMQYIIQMNWQMFVTGCNRNYFVSYYPAHDIPIDYIIFDRNQELIQQVFETCKDFYYNNLTAFKRPEPNRLILRNN